MIRRLRITADVIGDLALSAGLAMFTSLLVVQGYLLCH